MSDVSMLQPDNDYITSPLFNKEQIDKNNECYKKTALFLHQNYNKKFSFFVLISNCQALWFSVVILCCHQNNISQLRISITPFACFHGNNLISIHRILWYFACDKVISWTLTPIFLILYTSWSWFDSTFTNSEWIASQMLNWILLSSNKSLTWHNKCSSILIPSLIFPKDTGFLPHRRVIYPKRLIFFKDLTLFLILILYQSNQLYILKCRASPIKLLVYFHKTRSLFGCPVSKTNTIRLLSSRKLAFKL